MNTIKKTWLANDNELLQYARMTAEGLMYEWNIEKEGKQLPWILGITDARNNLDALTSWISEQIVMHQLSQEDAPHFIRIKLSNVFLDAI